MQLHNIFSIVFDRENFVRSMEYKNNSGDGESVYEIVSRMFFFLIQIQNWNIFHLPTLCILWIVSEISAAMERFSCRSCLVFIFCELTTSELLPKIVFCILMTFKLPSWINISRSQKLTKWNFIIVHKA